MKRILFVFVAIVLVVAMLCFSAFAYSINDAAPLWDYIFNVENAGDGQERVIYKVDRLPLWTLFVDGEPIFEDAADRSVDVSRDSEADSLYVEVITSASGGYLDVSGLSTGAPVSLSCEIILACDSSNVWGDARFYPVIYTYDSSGVYLGTSNGADHDIVIEGGDDWQEFYMTAVYNVGSDVAYIDVRFEGSFYVSNDDPYSSAALSLICDPLYLYHLREHILSEDELMQQVNDFVQAEADRQAGEIDDANQIIENAAQNRPDAGAINTDPSAVVDPVAMSSLSLALGSFYGLSPVAGFIGVLCVLIPVSYILFGKK